MDVSGGQSLDSFTHSITHREIRCAHSVIITWIIQAKRKYAWLKYVASVISLNEVCVSSQYVAPNFVCVREIEREREQSIDNQINGFNEM